MRFLILCRPILYGSRVSLDYYVVNTGIGGRRMIFILGHSSYVMNTNIFVLHLW